MGTLLDAYFDRIDFRPAPGATQLDLGRLHRQHLLHIPFENLSIHRGQKIELGFEALFDKLVTRKRGGFCFEMNGLFSWVLDQLNIQVNLFACSVFSPERKTWSDPFSHLALQVYHQYDYWLVDVGFGRSFPEPLRMVPQQIQHLDGIRYQFLTQADGAYLLQRQQGSQAYEAMYRFFRVPRKMEDFAGMSHFHQTSPDSPFTVQRLITRLIADGRVTLTDKELKITEGGQVYSQSLHSAEEFEAHLEAHFGMNWAGI